MIERRDFNDKAALAEELAASVGDNLRKRIKSTGEAALALSGGSTPKLFFRTLARRNDIDWSKLTITLVDERWVDASSGRSNAALVAENLLQGPAAAARFVPLYSGGEKPDAKRISASNKALATLSLPFSAVVLGMGGDGHTASFFPGGDALDAALSEAGPALAISAPGAGEPRITLTLPFLLKTDALYLHIEGEEKAKTLKKALGDGDVSQMPVRAVLRQTEKPVQIFWCP
ncbi:6-phosphogluconolactonase, eukaryotic type [hydrothermal vent metagenome]|uniref:6-phosphogluconolactonase, eukaryotic type n=1 Tax=hydrothermal vent metagenome TaxID=652676 RepID=A0A3B0U3S4_9ZZZZ